MKLIAYVLREYFKYVLGTISVGVFLFILFDFMHRASKNYFAEYSSSNTEIVLFYLYQLPHQILQTMPIATLIASLVTMVVLSRSNEVTVVRAAGLGPFQIALPLFIGGFILSIISLYLNHSVLPFTSKKMRYVQKVLIENESDLEFSGGPSWLKHRDTLFNYIKYDPINQKLEGIKLLDVTSNFQVDRMITAKEGIYDNTKGLWNLNNVVILDYARNGSLIFQKRVLEMSTILPIEPNKLQKERREPDELSADELKASIEKGEETGLDVLRQKISYYSKWAFPFASLFVSFLGLPFAFNSERKTESVKGILFAFLIGVSYWFLYSAFRAFGNMGYIAPIVAAWSANFVLLIVIILQFLKILRS